MSALRADGCGRGSWLGFRAPVGEAVRLRYIDRLSSTTGIAPPAITRVRDHQGPQSQWPALAANGASSKGSGRMCNSFQGSCAWITSCQPIIIIPTGGSRGVRSPCNGSVDRDRLFAQGRRLRFGRHEDNDHHHRTGYRTPSIKAIKRDDQSSTVFKDTRELAKVVCAMRRTR